MMVRLSNSHSGSPGSIPRRRQTLSLIATKLACKSDGGRGSRGYVQVMSADSSRMGEIEGTGMVELVYDGGLLRMGGDS